MKSLSLLSFIPVVCDTEIIFILLLGKENQVGNY
jgi:hypothetical protein